jgi:hypothetical protein
MMPRAMHISRIFLPLILSAASVCAAGAAHGQDSTVVTDFVLGNSVDASGVDRSYVGVTAHSGDRRAVMVWACTGTDTRLVFGFPRDPYGEQVSMTWRFAEEEPDSITLARTNVTASSVATYRLPDDQVHEFTTRILNGGRFVLTVLDASGPVEFVYFLDNADENLNSLGCVRALRPPSAPGSP